jgi:para-nitrobenzyl esterase
VIETQTQAGRVRGFPGINGAERVTVFRGIPFARPPVGELRFAAPVPPEPWARGRDAMSFGPPPPQQNAFGTGSSTRGDDWLTLNVWTPELGRGAGLPVMVWIHGGGYAVGASSLPEYDGATLALAGVVVVTFNYRVGVEGFAQIDGAPANRGLLDQVAALEWVRDNVGYFGGDPARVTVFGESAGAGSVACLNAMPLARGLFHRAIAQSVPGTFFTPALAHDIAGAIAAELGCRPTLAELAAVDPELLPVAVDEIVPSPRWGRAGLRSILFSPVVDGDVLPATPWAAPPSVDLVVGHTRDEHRLFTAMEGGVPELPDGFAPERYGDAELVLSDWLFRMPSLRLAERATGTVYVYELTVEGVLGACHGLDVPLVFGNLTGNQPAGLIADPVAAAAVSAHMRAAWVAFAATGDPGWPSFDTGLVQLFGPDAGVVPYPEAESRRIWRDHDFSPLDLV